MSSNSTTSTLQSHHLKNLLQILRRANYRYSSIAARIRASLTPTHHARNRAAKLGLGVDIQKAIHLDHRQVSVVPLPVIEQVISSPVPVSVVLAPVSSTLRPKFECTIPATVSRGAAAVAVGISTRHNEGWNTLTSSVPATLLDIQLLSPLELTPIETVDDDSSSVRIWLPTGSSALGPDAPVDEVEEDWEFDDSDDELSSVSPSPTLGGCYYSETSSSTSGSSTCILTPEIIDNAPLMIRIKRKSTEIRDDLEVIEKRPKFERKGWLLSTSDRPTPVNIPGR